MIIIISI